MSLLSDSGISPALLQVISQTLSKAPLNKEQMENSDPSSKPQKLVSRVIKDMKQPISLLSQPKVKQENPDRQVGRSSLNDVKSLLKMKLATHNSTEDMEDSGDLVDLRGDDREEFVNIVTGSAKDSADASVVDMLTAIATQHMKESARVVTSASQSALQTVASSSASTSCNTSSPQVIICYQDSSSNTELGRKVYVSQDGSSILGHGDGSQIIFQTSLSSDEEASENMTRVIRVSTDEDEMTDVQQVEVQSSASDSMSVSTGNHMSLQDHNEPCPICGDVVSGYHYGIFTCESCKGFFKRTVQNKKTFVCHRCGECEINVENRKRCPACRFAKCLVMGMKLGAIRTDRTRGGRSSYDGCSSHGRTKALIAEKKHQRPIRIACKSTMPNMSLLSTTSGASYGGSQLVAILNKGEGTATQELGKAFVPQVLTDVMNLESLMCEEDLPPELMEEKFSEDDPNLFLTVLQLTELKLYKIVRWARNLPQFASIATDDQILLLQNCWCDLLALNSCWRSVHRHDEIHIYSSKVIDQKKAKYLGIMDLFMKLIELVDHLRRLVIDQYEYVALKVLILIGPGKKVFTK
ncbi:hypothetical protein CHS0354_009751 [Potamilus streckersoni]|uniref:Uncharacterized protein n=1 Tax=Potamilus streckersoni TaxID=2493646 RepID=A0AAE0TIA8_9BIVA|nr:hypothetical protein CHS0354_009751 [Potamilus streckersoni]